MCRDPLDFRKSIDGLAAIVERSFGANPFDTLLYVFVNARCTKVKALHWQRNGFRLSYKRLKGFDRWSNSRTRHCATRR